MESIIDSVIQRVENNKGRKENYDYDNFKLAIKLECRNNDAKVNQLFIEALEANSATNFISSGFSFGAFVFAIISIGCSVCTYLLNYYECSYKKFIDENHCTINIVLIIASGIAFLSIIYCFVFQFSGYKRYRYSEYILKIIKSDYKRIIGI